MKDLLYGQAIQKTVESLKFRSGNSDVYVWLNPEDFPKVDQRKINGFKLLEHESIPIGEFYVSFDKNHFKD